MPDHTSLLILLVSIFLVLVTGILVILRRLRQISPEGLRETISKAFKEGIENLQATTAEHVQIRQVLALIEQNEPLDKLAQYGDQLVGSSLTYTVERLKTDLKVVQDRLAEIRSNFAHHGSSNSSYYNREISRLETMEADLQRRLGTANFKLQEFNSITRPTS